MQIQNNTAVQPDTPTSRSFPGNCRNSNGLAALLTALPASKLPLAQPLGKGLQL
jgi:hypothetical protein